MIYNSRGKTVSFKRMLANVSNAELVFFGEFYDHPIFRRLQLELLFKKNGSQEVNFKLLQVHINFF